MLTKGKEGANRTSLHQVVKSWSPWFWLSVDGRARIRNAWAALGFNPDTASVLRYELDMALLRISCWFSVRHRRQVNSLQKEHDLKIHLGCGNVLFNGWVNVDCYPPPKSNDVEILVVDMRRRLPFSDASVMALFSEHFLEHLPLEIVRKHLLPEIRRILAPAGVVRLAVPNGEYFIKQYLALKAGAPDPLFEANLTGETGMMALNNVVRGGGHCFLYDFDTMAMIMREAGFNDIAQVSSGDTQYEVFHGNDRTDEWRAAMSLYVEATVPG